MMNRRMVMQFDPAVNELGESFTVVLRDIRQFPNYKVAFVEVDYVLRKHNFKSLQFALRPYWEDEFDEDLLTLYGNSGVRIYCRKHSDPDFWRDEDLSEYEVVGRSDFFSFEMVRDNPYGNGCMQERQILGCPPEWNYPHAITED